MPRIELPADDEALLDQCEFQAFRASGKGGQHVNKTDSAVRLRHVPTGIVVQSQESRSQWQNRFICLRKLRARVQALNVVAKPRKATKKPASAKRKTLAAKTRLSEKKKLRGGRDWKDE
jgi:peptide chain release factor 2